MSLIDRNEFLEFERLWDEESLQEEIKEVFGEFDPDRWSLEAGTQEAFDKFIKTGKPLDEFYENEIGFAYQPAWNCAVNDERSKYLAMRKYADDNQYKTALEYGCGIGSGAVTLVLAGLDVWAVDVCKPALEVLKARRKRYGIEKHLTVAKAVNAVGKWKWNLQKFDLVVCTEVFEHVEDPIELVKHLYEVINPGGAMIASWSFVPMPTHVVNHFHLQHSHPDRIEEEGFGKILGDIGFKLDRTVGGGSGHTWFNNSAWKKE